MSIGFGDQTNLNFTTNSLSFVTAYTIPVINFRPNKSYILFTSWTQAANGIVTARLRYNSTTLPRSEYINETSVSIGERANAFNIARIDQGSTVLPITLEVAYGGGSGSATIDHIRWFAIDITDLDPNDFSYAEQNTPTDIPTGGHFTILTDTIFTNNEEWLIFYELNAQDNGGIINPTTSGSGFSLQANFNNSFPTLLPVHRFQLSNENRSQSFMKYISPFLAGNGIRDITLQVAKNTAIPNTLFATGSIFAIKLGIFNGSHSDGQLNNVINISIAQDYVVWNIGWNADNGVMSTNSVSIPPGDEIDTFTTGPMNFDWRSDLLSIGSHTFEQSNGLSDDKRHAVLFFSPPIDSVSHSTNSFLYALRTLGHSTNSLLSISFSGLNHSSNSLLFNNTIYGSSEFFVGANIDANGIVDGIVNSINPSCLNSRILGKYGWEPTSTPTKTFTKCNPKR